MNGFQLMSRLFLGGVLLLNLTTPAMSYSTVVLGPEEMIYGDIPIQAATKSDIKQIDSPQAVTVLTKSDIERIPANNLGELLRPVVGINVIKPHSGQNVLGIHGSNVFAPSKILLLVDGQPVDLTLFSTAWWDLLPVNLKDIERVEVIRSPGTLYGADAQAGVINLITQKVHPGEPNVTHAKVEVKSGEQNLRWNYGGVMGKAGPVSYRFSAESNEVHAYENGGHPSMAVPGELSAREEHTFSENKKQLKAQTFSGNVQTLIGDGDVLAVSGGSKNIGNVQGEVPDRLGLVGIDGEVAYVMGKYSFETLGIQQNLSVGSAHIGFRFHQNDDMVALSPTKTDLEKTDIGYEFNTPLGGRNTLLTGVTYRLETAENVEGVPFFAADSVNNRVFLGAHLQDEWKLTNSDTLYLGGLYSRHYISGSRVAPMLAYVRRLNENNVFRLASYTSYRHPDVFEHSTSYDQTSGAVSKAVRFVPNPNLRAERTTSYEIGLRSQATEALFFSTDFYVNRLRHGIEWTLVGTSSGPARPHYRSENTLEQFVGGVDVTMQYRLNPNMRLENNAAFTHLYSRSSNPATFGALSRGVNNVGQGRYGSQYVPPYIFNTSLNLDRGKIHARIHNQYTAAHLWQWPQWQEPTDTYTLKPVPAYNIVNAHLGVDVTRFVKVAVEGLNILNKLHSEYREDESYFGRQLWTKVTVEF